MPASDRGTLTGLTQFIPMRESAAAKALNANEIELDTRIITGVCDKSVRSSSQVVDSKVGEMSEWLKEHAWKLIPLARADAHRHALTQFPPTTSRNNDVHRSVPVNHGV
jgi:hypothetical protein